MTHHHIKSKVHLLKTGVPVFKDRRLARHEFLDGTMSMPAGTSMDEIMSSVDDLLKGKTTTRQTESVDRGLAQIEDMCNAANYCVDDAVVQLLRRADVVDSIRILLEHGMARLPVSPMLLEFQLIPGYHDFVLLEELAAEPLVLDFRYGVLELATGKAMITGKKTQLDITYLERTLKDMKLTDDLLDLYKHGAQLEVASVIGARLALLMLNTLGIEREVVEAPAKLNKARAKHGRPPIGTSTIVHIGRIYKRDGSAVSYAGGGWHLPMHIRQAHVRNVPYGPRKGVAKDERPTKLTVIPMCIVNYDPAQPAPTIKKEVRA